MCHCVSCAVRGTQGGDAEHLLNNGMDLSGLTRKVHATFLPDVCDN